MERRKTIEVLIFSLISSFSTDGFFGKSDPFLRFFKKSGDNWLQVYESEFVKDTLNPLWRPFEI